MNENSATKKTSISQAETIEEIADFWDAHSLDDYWEQTHAVDFTVTAQRRHRVALDPDVYAQLATQAHLRGVSPETLVNLWVTERLQHIE